MNPATESDALNLSHGFCALLNEMAETCAMNEDFDGCIKERDKIGTFQVATMAKQHGIPFYVAAPLSTFDMKTDAKDVIIEMRKGVEVTGIGDKQTAPDGINVINPAFDMTPPELISGIITEKGIVKPPFDESIKKIFEAKK